MSALSKISIFADLSCELDGSPVVIRTEGNRWIVELPNSLAAVRLLRVGPSKGSTRKMFAMLQKALVALQSTIDFKVGSQVVARAGYRVHNRWCDAIGYPGLSCGPVALAVLAVGDR